MFSIPLLMLSGFFSSSKNFVPYLIPFKYLSLFKWAYQLFIQNEFSDSPPLTCQNPPNPCNPLGNFDFDESMATSFAVASAVSLFFGILGFILVYALVKIKL